jgi:iron complex outermembrane receptor protein
VYTNRGTFQAGPLPGLVNVYGQESARSEGLNAFEVGHRYQANRKLWLDIASFYNVYDHLSTTEPGATFFQPDPAPHVVAPVYFGNAMKGETYGAELAASYELAPSFSLKGSYSFLRLALHGYNGTVTSEGAEGRSPQNQAYIGAFLNLPRSFEISGHAYFVGSLPNFQTPAYTRLDLNLGWKRWERLELNLVGQNLLGSHMEFGDQGSPANVVKRSIFAKTTWRF